MSQSRFPQQAHWRQAKGMNGIRGSVKDENLHWSLSCVINLPIPKEQRWPWRPCEINFDLFDPSARTCKNPTIYNIIQWFTGSLGQMTHRPSVWCSKYYFFSQFLAKFFAKIVSIYFSIFFYKFTKIKIKSFECPKSIRNYEKNNAWNIRRLVDESFVPATQRIILKIVGFLLCNHMLQNLTLCRVYVSV